MNATRYHATVKLTQKAIDAGWVLDTTLSQLECDLVIQQRPVHVYSYHNDKVYDRASAGIINNITPKAADGVSGIIAGDIVQVNTTTVMGNYVDKDSRSYYHLTKEKVQKKIRCGGDRLRAGRGKRGSKERLRRLKEKVTSPFSPRCGSLKVPPLWW